MSVHLGLVHDYLLVKRGAERTFLEMAACWPRAPVHTLLYDARVIGDELEGARVSTSPLQRLPVRQRGLRWLLPLLPAAAERLPVGGYDVVVSSSSAFAHGVRAGSTAAHVCYCHSPFRYAYFERERALAECPPPLRPFLARTLRRIRRWDQAAAGRVTAYVANSSITSQRIADLYGRPSEIVHPPVRTERFRPGVAEDFVLFVGEMTTHKRVETALDAAKRAGRPIKLVGDGPQLERLRQVHSGPQVEFAGRVSDEALADLYSRCLALIVPNVEEFGIAAVEAQAAGRPVVALDAGGARETVVAGETGVLVSPSEPDALAEALRFTDFDRFDPLRAQRQADLFSASSFRERLAAIVARQASGGPDGADGT